MAAKATGVVKVVLDRYGRTYAGEAGIRLADRPQPLYQLLVLATLLSARISGEVAVRAAGELFRAGFRSPKAMREATWQDRVDALGRGHYRRYDERTATMLGEGAELAGRRWDGDLRKLHREAGHDSGAIRSLLTEFPGIGPAGAEIFLREVQGVWPDVAPYFDSRVLSGARKIGLPSEPEALADLAGPGDKVVLLAAALVRVSLSRTAADEILAAGRGGPGQPVR
jgi:endonuclease III